MLLALHWEGRGRVDVDVVVVVVAYSAACQFIGASEWKKSSLRRLRFQESKSIR